MRATVIFSLLFFVSFLGWRLTERLSADALGLATGVVLGILAGLPVALLMMAASRRQARDDDEDDYARSRRQSHGQLSHHAPQPPVIILSGYPQGNQGYGNGHSNNYGNGAQMSGGYGQHALPAPSDIVDARRFHVVGEDDEAVDEW